MVLNLLFALSSDKVNVPLHKAQANNSIDLKEIETLMRSNPPEQFFKLRETAKIYFEQRSYDEGLKSVIRAYKEQLPYFLASGFCPVHHNDHSLEYNGCLQIDIDFKHSEGNTKALTLKDRIKAMALPFIAMCAISPSGYGVKMLVATTNTDKQKHGEALRDLIAILSNILDIPQDNFDSLGASQPCYVPFDKDAFFNHDVKAYEWTPKTTLQRNDVPDNTELVHQAVTYLIDNKINVATSYSEYLSITAACINAFGHTEGSMFAYDLLSHSPQFLDSNFSKNFANHTRFHRNNGNMATAGTLVYLAKENGWKPSFSLPKAKRQTILRGQEGDKFTTILKENRVELTPEQFCNKNWIVPTGTGKTFAVAMFAKNNKTVIVCPTLALVENVCKEYGATKFTGDHRQLIGDETFIATTYSSYAALLNRLPHKEFHVFIDEAHNFTSSTHKAFLLDELTTVLNQSTEFYASVTLLTGTDLYSFHPTIAAMPKIIVKVPRPKKRFEVINYKNGITTIVEAVTKSISQGRFPIVLFNDTGAKLAALQALLSHLDIAFFNSNEKDNEDFIKTVKDGIIPDTIKGIVTTTVLKEGNNIYNNYQYDIISVGQHHSSTIEQLANRPRNPKEVKVYLLKGEGRERTEETFDTAKEGGQLIWRTQKACNELNSNDIGDAFALEMELYGRNAIQRLFLNPNTQGGYSLDYLQISNEIFNRETTAEYRNDNYQIANLEKYGFEYETTRHFTSEMSQEDKETAQQANKIRKDKEAIDYQKELDIIQQRFDALHYCQKQAQNRTATKGQKRAAMRIAQLQNLSYTTSQAVALVNNIGSDTNFKMLKNRLIIQSLRNNEDYMNSNRLFPILMQKFYTTFDTTETYTKEAIREKVVECLSLDKSIFLKPFLAHDENDKRIDQCLKTLRLFVDVKGVSQRGGKDVSKVYKICNLTFTELDKNNSEKLGYKLDLPTVSDLERMLNLTDNGYPVEWDLPMALTK